MMENVCKGDSVMLFGTHGSDADSSGLIHPKGWNGRYETGFFYFLMDDQRVPGFSQDWGYDEDYVVNVPMYEEVFGDDMEYDATWSKEFGSGLKVWADSTGKAVVVVSLWEPLFMHTIMEEDSSLLPSEFVSNTAFDAFASALRSDAFRSWKSSHAESVLFVLDHTSASSGSVRREGTAWSSGCFHEQWFGSRDDTAAGLHLYDGSSGRSVRYCLAQMTWDGDGLVGVLNDVFVSAGGSEGEESGGSEGEESGEGSSQASVSLCTYNICRGRAPGMSVGDIAGAAGGVLGLRVLPDVLCLQEVERNVPSSSGGSGQDQAALMASSLGYPYYAFAGHFPLGSGSYGLAVLAKEAPASYEEFDLPFSDSEDSRVTGLKGQYLEWEGYAVANVHVSYFTGLPGQKSDTFRALFSALDGIVSWKASGKPLFVLGDFNCQMSESHWQVLTSRLTCLSDPSSHTAVEYPERTAIDHVFVMSETGSGVRTESFLVGSSRASDHYPVLVTASVPETSAVKTFTLSFDANGGTGYILPITVTV